MKNIVLVGYMGCGKTTVGKHLARICNLNFMDADEQIEKEQQKTISEIFAVQGEPAFREMETAFLKKLLADQIEGIVLSTGGGMPVKEENISLLRQLGTVYYLKAEPETVFERIKGDTKRPLLQCEEPLKKIKEMTQQRTPFYEKAAHQIISVDTYKQSEIAEMIQSMW